MLLFISSSFSKDLFHLVLDIQLQEPRGKNMKAHLVASKTLIEEMTLFNHEELS